MSVSRGLGLDRKRVFVATQFPQVGRRLHGDADGLPEKRIQSLQPKHLALKHDSKIARDGMCNVLQQQLLT